MFKIDEDMTIHCTRGDVGVIKISAEIGESAYVFNNDVLRMNIHKKKDCKSVYMIKSVEITEESETAEITLDSNDTKFGECISKPREYWYEIELNPDTNPQTIIGYDDITGPKKFILYPEGGVDE